MNKDGRFHDMRRATIDALRDYQVSEDAIKLVFGMMHNAYQLGINVGMCETCKKTNQIRDRDTHG